MAKPMLAIVGKPNVGKSTFFNRLAGKRISIVEDTPGITRDRIYADAEWAGYAFTIIDTGGIDLTSTDEINKHIITQAQIAIDVADVVLMICDGKVGLTESDREVATLLRKSGRPVVLAVNKIDVCGEAGKTEFYALGLGEVHGISSEHGLGIGDCLDACVELFKTKVVPEEEDGKVKVAIVGRPNAGKSSITNRILGTERVVVSSVAGTTRDAIDTPFKFNGKDYVIIDTAGIRRQRSISYESVEGYSVMRALQAIRRADIVVCVLDANEEVSEQDVRIIGYVHEQGKPSVVVYNKWDLIEKDERTVIEFQNKLKNSLAFMDYFVAIYISALTGKRFGKIMEQVEYVFANTQKRITTGLLNEIVQDAISTAEPPTRNGKRLKINYISQVATKPPTFAIFVNTPELMHFSYKRYLENCIRRAVDFNGTPIRLYVRKKSGKDKE